VERKKDGRRNEWKKEVRKATCTSYVGLFNEAVTLTTPAWWLDDSRTVYNEPACANRLSKVFVPFSVLIDEWVPRW
jgi:hypothetical protein